MEIKYRTRKGKLIQAYYGKSEFRIDDQWVTSKEGNHALIDEGGDIKVGFGKTLEAQYPSIKEFAGTSKSPVDFHVQMWMEYGDKCPINSSNREKLWNKYKDQYSMPKYKPTVGKVDDYIKLKPKLKKMKPEIYVTNLGKGSVMGCAGNAIYINPNYFNSNQNLKKDFYHEIGHVIHHYLNIFDEINHNYGDVWGKYNNKLEVFEGITGRLEGPHEDFANIFANYVINPKFCEKTFPDAYKVMNHIMSNVDYKSVINKYEKELKKAGIKLE